LQPGSSIPERVVVVRFDRHDVVRERSHHHRSTHRCRQQRCTRHASPHDRDQRDRRDGREDMGRRPEASVMRLGLAIVGQRGADVDHLREKKRTERQPQWTDVLDS